MKGSRRRKHDKAAQQAGTMTPRPNPAVALIGLWTAALFARAKAAVAVAAEPEPTTKLERELLRSEKSEALKRYRQEFLHRYRFGNNKFDQRPRRMRAPASPDRGGLPHPCQRPAAMSAQSNARYRAKSAAIAVERVLILSARLHRQFAAEYRAAGNRRAAEDERQAAARALRRITSIGEAHAH